MSHFLWSESKWSFKAPQEFPHSVWCCLTSDLFSSSSVATCPSPSSSLASSSLLLSDSSFLLFFCCFALCLCFLCFFFWKTKFQTLSYESSVLVFAVCPFPLFHLLVFVLLLVLVFLLFAPPPRFLFFSGGADRGGASSDWTGNNKLLGWRLDTNETFLSGQVTTTVSFFWHSLRAAERGGSFGPNSSWDELWLKTTAFTRTQRRNLSYTTTSQNHVH